VFVYVVLVRLYDVRTFQCFVASNPNDQHTAPVTAVTMAHSDFQYHTLIYSEWLQYVCYACMFEDFVDCKSNFRRILIMM